MTSSKKSPKAVRNFDVQDDIYIVNATDFGSDLLAVRYSSDHKLIAIGGASPTLKTVQPNTHVVINSFEVPSEGTDSSYDPITCIREHTVSTPTSTLMITSFASGYVRCWDVNSKQIKFNIKEERQSLGIGVGRENFVTTGDDGVLYLYDATTNKVISKLESSPFGDVVDGHATRAFAAIFHPTNTKEIISGGWDDSIHFWDSRQKQSVRRIGSAHICGSDALDISNNGNEILAGSYQKVRQIQMWDYSSGKILRTLTTDNFSTSMYAAAFLSDVLICAGGSDPNLFKVVNSQQPMTTGLVKSMAGGVASIHKGRTGLQYPAKPKLNKGRDHPEKSNTPRVAFCAGQFLFEVELY